MFMATQNVGFYLGFHLTIYSILPIISLDSNNMFSFKRKKPFVGSFTVFYHRNLGVTYSEDPAAFTNDYKFGILLLHLLPISVVANHFWLD